MCNKYQERINWVWNIKNDKLAMAIVETLDELIFTGTNLLGWYFVIWKESKNGYRAFFFSLWYLFNTNSVMWFSSIFTYTCCFKMWKIPVNLIKQESVLDPCQFWQ